MNGVENFFQAVDSQLRLDGIIAVSGSDSDCQRIDFGLFGETFCLVNARNQNVNAFVIAFRAADATDFRFDCRALCMSQLDDFASAFDIFFERIFRAVEHHGSKSEFQRKLNRFECRAVIQMDGSRHFAFPCGGEHDFSEQIERRIFQTTFSDLQNQRRVEFLCCLNRAPSHFHIRDVEGTDCKRRVVMRGEKVGHFYEGHLITPNKKRNPIKRAFYKSQ